MMYTVGDRVSYELMFKEPESVQYKKGIEGDYQGGIVFETYYEAHQRLVEKHLVEYDVYGLLTDITNRHQVEGEDFWRIKESAKLVKLVN